MPGLQELALVYNPTAGSRPRLRRRRTLEEVVAALKSSGGHPQLFPTCGAGDGLLRAQEAARAFPLVAVMGGDGTVNEVINGVVAADSGARLLLLPAGTVNVLARDLRIPLDPCRAAALLRDGLERRIFLGRAGRRYFALMASAGVDAAIVRRLAASRLKPALGPVAFILEGIRHSLAYRFPRLTVRADTQEVAGYLAVVGNSPGYGGWFSVTPGADPGQPGFQIAVCTSNFRLKYYYFLGLALTGALQRSRDFVYLRSSRVYIASELPVWVQLDGEPYDSLPMEFVSDGASLQFLVPPASLPARYPRTGVELP